MKKLLLFSLFIFLIIVSCTKEDDDDCPWEDRNRSGIFYQNCNNGN